MMGLRAATVAALLALGLCAAPALAEQPKSRTILDYLFGAKPSEAPANIAPSAPLQTSPVLPSRPATASRPAKSEAAKEASRKTSLRKPAKAGAPDAEGKPARRVAASAPHSSAYMGPFRGGGSQAVCVRSCDGFFFPINYEGASNGDRYTEACQSSCPSAQVEVYFMPRGADLTRAATARGERYSALENAFKYRKERDATCTCKGSQQRWADVLAPLEALMKHGKNETVVSEDAIAQAGGILPILTGGDRADASLVRRPDTLRATSGEAWTQSTRFLKADTEPTGSITRR